MMNKFILVTIIFLSFFTITAQNKVNLKNPQAAVRSHLDYLQPENYDENIAAQIFNPDTRGIEEAKEYAVKFKQLLDGRGLLIYTDEISSNPNYYDSASNSHKYVLLKEYPKIFLLKAQDGNWYYSDSSLDAINKLYSNTFIFGTGHLLELFPKIGLNKKFGQYILIFFLTLLSVLIYKLFFYLSEKFIKRYLKKSGYEGEQYEKYVSLIAKPLSIFLILLLFRLFVPALQLPASYSKYIMIVLDVLIPLLGTVIIYRFVNILSIYLGKLAAKTEGTLDDQLVPLLRKTLKTFVIIVGTLYILDNLKVPILPLLTGLSIGGLAFALAAQDTIKNFFGSLMIFVDKPFQVGDWITSGDVDGTVEEVGFRSSRIRTFRNSLIYIPNGILADNTIDNHGLRKQRRFYTHITITYDTPPELIELFVQGLRKIVDNHPRTAKNYHIYLNDMAASSLNIIFYIFFKVPDWGNELQSRHEVLMEVIKLAKELGVNFAFPTQTLHMENLPGQPSLSPSYETTEQLELKMKDYFSQKN